VLQPNCPWAILCFCSNEKTAIPDYGCGAGYTGRPDLFAGAYLAQVRLAPFLGSHAAHQQALPRGRSGVDIRGLLLARRALEDPAPSCSRDEDLAAGGAHHDRLHRPGAARTSRRVHPAVSYRPQRGLEDVLSTCRVDRGAHLCGSFRVFSKAPRSTWEGSSSVLSPCSSSQASPCW
jgi:hypothetical protein